MSFHRLAAFSAAFFLAASTVSHTVALRLILLVVTAGLLLASAARGREGIRFAPPLGLILVYVLWEAWALLSITWALEPERAAKEVRNEIGYTALAFWVCFVAAQARGAARIMLPIAAIGVVVACGIAIHSYALGVEQYMAGWHGGAGNHSSLLLTSMPCALMIAWYGLRNGWGRGRLWLTAALIALFLVAAYTTQNRTVWLGFGVEVLLVITLVNVLRPTGPGLGLRARAGVALLSLAVVAGAVAATAVVHSERTSQNSAKALEKDPRLALWPEVLERIEARPLTGYGFGLGGLRSSLREELGDPMLWHAHNLFLETTLQLGLPGLALLFALIAATLREAWRVGRRGEDVAVACGVALAAVVAGMLVRNMTDITWLRQNALLYWGVAGVLLGLGMASRVSTGAR